MYPAEKGTPLVVAVTTIKLWKSSVGRTLELNRWITKEGILILDYTPSCIIRVAWLIILIITDIGLVIIVVARAYRRY